MGKPALAERVISPQPAPSLPRLLLVGEHPPALAAACGDMACSVERVATGAEALEAAGGEVVLIAASLPDGSGVDAMRALLARSPETLAVLRSEGVSPAAGRRLREAGAWAVIGGGDWSGGAQVIEAAVALAAARRQAASARGALARANRLQIVGQLSAEIAHEVNNVVTFLSTNLHYLSDLSAWRADRRRELLSALDASADPAAVRAQLLTWLHEDEGDERRCLEETLEGARQIRRIARELRDLSRGGRAVEPRVFSLEAVVREALKYASVRAGPGVALRLRVEGEARAVGQRDRVVQLVLNLLINALNAVGERGVVAVAVRALGDRVEIAVEDSGGGVPPELEARIFEPFFTTRPEADGTGLGLSICRDIAAEHGGAIRLEPQPEGARFVVTLPGAGGLVALP